MHCFSSAESPNRALTTLNKTASANHYEINSQWKHTMYQLLQDNNLNIYLGWQYEGFPVQRHIEYHIEEYLEGTYRTMLNALLEYPKTCVVRVDLKIPKFYQSNSDRLILRFFEFLQVHIDTDLKKRNNYQQPLVVCKSRYVAARDLNLYQTEQYHILLTLNLDVYNGLNNEFDNVGGNVFNKIGLAWAEALDNDFEFVLKYRLVHIPKDPVSHINSIKGNPFNDSSEVAKTFLRFSHFTTTEGKSFNQGYSPFLCSAD